MKITPDAFAVLTDLDEGDFQREVDDALAEVIEAVTLHGKRGAVTITIPIEPAFRDGQMGVLIGGKVVGKKPTGVASGTFRYIRKDGNLSKSNPGQTPLPFTTVSDDTETRIVSAQSAEVRSVN